MNKQTQQKLTKARTALLLDNPFFGTLLLRLKLEELPGLPTAGTDGEKLYYNSQWIDSLPPEHLKAVLAHEIMHVALLHHTRRGEREPMVWNIAGDLAINPILEKSGFSLPQGALLEPQFENMTAEEIYKKLPQSKKQKGGGSGQDNDGQGNPDPGKMGGVMDAPGGSKDAALNAEARKLIEEEIKIAVQQAAQAAKAAGNIPGGLQRLVDELVNPILPWRDILRRFINSVAKSDYTWTRPNRRYISQGLYLPSMYSDEIDRIVLAIDTSGSIDTEALNQFSAELSSILDYLNTELTVIYCDAKVQKVETYQKVDLPLNLRPRGGGGTDFRPVFKYVEENNLQPSVLIYFTDLECYQYPKTPFYPVLWAVYGSGGEEPKFGEVIKIK